MDWEKVRAEFPALANWTYLNTATFGQLPRRATEAVSRHFAHRDELACSDFLSWFDDADRLRGKIGQLFHAGADDVSADFGVPKHAGRIGGAVRRHCVGGGECRADRECAVWRRRLR